ncbi:hypothetical protein FA13DRAFT_766651 [Coprinellus micaceus]|uniref:Uncharacterized protein n=1 Tax=Coprinellus micaceus TaxID=71717 RepID=A0A4Y7S9Q4_COPMI|nr:hypothetical protein FA13DRAFT_766651 [Coprinellus micaceus]
MLPASCLDRLKQHEEENGYCITDKEQTMGSSRSSASWLANHPSPLLYFFRRLHFALTTTGWNLIWFLAFLFWGRALARRGGFSRSIVGGATGIYRGWRSEGDGTWAMQAN